MQLNDKVYDILKWVTLVLIPASTTLYVTIAPVLNLPYANEVAKCSVAVCTFLGALLGISTAQYNKGEEPFDEDQYWEDDEESEEE